MRESNHAFAARRHYSGSMLFLAAFARLSPPPAPPRETEQNEDLLAESHEAMGHLGLTVIALVFVLLTFWKA